jgi:isoleucyl-tRNA synthetase
MDEKYKSADLILKLYELRREEKMREARNWFATFFPESAEEIMQTVLNPETSANYRMVISYWDMAASFVNHGAIDAEMFNDVSGESIMVFSRVEPFLEELREITKRPQMLANLEKVVMSQPNAKEMLATQREMMKKYMQARAEMAQKA